MVNFTIIIPVKEINSYVRETVPYIQLLNRRNWELIILPNEYEINEWNDSRIHILPSGRVGPAEKRDLAASTAQGEILVFLDDDSYPSHNFLEVAEKYFEDKGVVAIGGPAITPEGDSFWQHVSGAVFLSRFSGGVPERYISKGFVREISDWPSVNLMVRRTDFLKVGGFNSTYWPGEDTKLCLDLIETTNKKILYIPEMIVWHHRRSGLIAHLKQIGAYALHRGYFSKKYPKTSRKLIYFMPTLFVLFIIFCLVVFLFLPNYMILILIGWLIYCLALLKAYIDMRKYVGRKVSLVALFYTFLTHCWYGIRFVQGLSVKKLVTKLR